MLYFDLQRASAQQIGVATIMTYWKYTTHQQEGVYSWDEPDTAMAIAELLEIPTHGHPLVWGSDTHIPEWVLNKPLSEGEAIMLDHIRTVAGRYAGKMDAWDVVNEAIEDDGTYRNSYWNRAMTGEFVIKAFREAHTTDPAAELIYNDYGMEVNQVKFDGVKSLLSWLISEDVGLTGLGWQLHVYVDDVLDPGFQLGSYMAEISAMGLKNYVTELDIRIPDYSTYQQERQKQAYKKILEIFLNNSTHGEYFQTWGLSDQYTWWNDFDPTQTHYPLPFDTVMSKKPAYWGMVEAMAEALGQGPIPGNYRIKNVGRSMYLSQTTDQEGAEVNIQSLNSSWTSQQWTIEDGPDASQRLQCLWKDWYLNIGEDRARSLD